MVMDGSKMMVVGRNSGRGIAMQGGLAKQKWTPKRAAFWPGPACMSFIASSSDIVCLLLHNQEALPYAWHAVHSMLPAAWRMPAAAIIVSPAAAMLLPQP